jgi:hypothetical protein
MEERNHRFGFAIEGRTCKVVSCSGVVPGSLGAGAATSSITTGVFWSPDGTRLLYVGCCNASLHPVLISVSATGDAAPVVLVIGYPSISDTGLSWQSVGAMEVER